MLETGSDYLEDLVSVLKDLNKEHKFEDLDKDKYYEEAANKAGMTAGQSQGYSLNKSITPSVPKKPDATINSSGIKGQKSGKNI